MSKSAFPIVLIITGLALILGSLFFLLDKATSAQPSGLGGQIVNILVLLLGAGAGIKGWVDLQKGKSGEATGKGKDQRTQELINSPRSKQTMKGKGGIQKQKASDSSDSEQHME